MNYTELIDTIVEVINNDKINKQGLVLTYNLIPENHKKLQEELFYRTTQGNDKIEYKNEYELEMGGLIIRFVKDSI